MKVIFIFDVDKTLTFAGQTLEETNGHDGVSKGYSDNLNDFAEKAHKYGHRMIIATGTSTNRIHQQLDAGLLKTHPEIAVFASMGHDRWDYACTSGGQTTIRKGEAKHCPELEENASLWTDLIFLKNEQNADFPSLRFNGREVPAKIDRRQSMMTLLCAGPHENSDARKAYCDWAAEENDLQRKQFAQFLRARHPDLDVQVAGKTSIDIIRKIKDDFGEDTVDGKNCIFKDALFEDFKEDFINGGRGYKLMLIADETTPGGNDYPLAKEVLKFGGDIISVTSPAMTEIFLKHQSGLLSEY